MQCRKAKRSLAALTRRVHCANAYRYRKQSEFLRVCYKRALVEKPGYKMKESSVVATSDSDNSNNNKKLTLLLTLQKEDAVKTTVPRLFPRKWPHLPYRSLFQWHMTQMLLLSFSLVWLSCQKIVCDGSAAAVIYTHNQSSVASQCVGPGDISQN